MPDIANDYIKWLCRKVRESDDDSSSMAYSRLFTKLLITSFYSEMEMDQNRSFDGLELRYEFIQEEDDRELLYCSLNEECSVLEMLVALAMRIEHDLMFDIRYGDRTGSWFWLMLENLGLNSMDDNHYDEEYVSYVLGYFLDRKYGRDGKGGLFTVRNEAIDMRNLDIWYQMNAYFDENYFYWE